MALYKFHLEHIQAVEHHIKLQKKLEMLHHYDMLLGTSQIILISTY